MEIRIECAAKCGASDRVPARKREVNSPPDDIVPVQGHPYICLACWRAGWRSEAPADEGQPHVVYQLPGHPQTLFVSARSLLTREGKQ